AGVAAYDAGDYQKAFHTWWELRYEDLAAMRNLAMMSRRGQGTDKDPKQAEELFLRAAEAGLPTAQADLADMYLKGELGPPDLARALPLLEAAAAANHPVAQYQLGEFYETGAPPLVPQDLETARQLYDAAASHGMAQNPQHGDGLEQDQPVIIHRQHTQGLARGCTMRRVGRCCRLMARAARGRQPDLRCGAFTRFAFQKQAPAHLFGHAMHHGQ